MDRRPVVYFYTTSAEKFAQAQQLFRLAGLSVTQFRSRNDPYHEHEDATSEFLLAAAVTEIVETVPQASNSLFFVEDTSLRIEGLSDVDRDFPGLSVKDWFARTSFLDLDSELRARGNDRRATVKSDIALHVPKLSTPIFFHGETSGVVADEPSDCDPDPVAPWIGTNNFNAWFTPDEGSKPLGAMSVEEAWRFDFRAAALGALLDRLEEYAAVVNLPATAAPRRRTAVGPVGVERLFRVEGLAFVVVGPTCAGKTTFGRRAAGGGWSGGDGLLHVEASDVVRSFELPRLPEDTAASFARRVIESDGADVVARRIVDDYYREDLDDGFVITGFRTIPELMYLKERVPRTMVIHVDAPSRVRHERFQARRRSDERLTLVEFLERDREQEDFGLLAVSAQIADFYLPNEETLEAYLAQVDAICGGLEPLREVRGLHSIPTRFADERNQLHRCLLALSEQGRPMTTEELEHVTGIRHNNANKMLKRYPVLARRLEAGSSRIRYDVTDPGRAFVRYVQRHVSQR